MKFEQLKSSRRRLQDEINQLSSELNELSAINRLPIELQCMLFGQLGVENLIRCEFVCKRWQQIVHGLNVQKLVIAKRMQRRPRAWRHSGERCAPNSVVLRSDLNFNALKSSFLFGIKQLKICNSSDDHGRPEAVPLITDTNFINRLTSLEVLEIKRFGGTTHTSNLPFHIDRNSRDQHTLTLPNLQHLTIEFLHCRIKLNTPSLVSYRTVHLNANANFIFPLKITRLFVDGNQGMEMFRSLSSLCLNAEAVCFSDHGELKKRFFDHFQLKELQIRPKLADYGKFRRCLAELLALKQRFGRTSMRILFAGVPIERMEQLADYELDRESMARFHLRNYSQLHANDLRWLNAVHYSKLIECVRDGVVDALPSDFHQKFDQVKKVIVSGQPQRLEHLIGFLKQFRNLQALKVLTPLDEAAYARLAADCPQIWSLEVKNVRERQSVDFIFKFPNLHSFSTDLQLRSDSIRKVFAGFESFQLAYNRPYEGQVILKRKHGQRIEEFPYEEKELNDIFNDLEDYLECHY